MPIAAPDSTLQAIQNKVRRLTRSPSIAQLTEADLQNYINTFIVYDFPEHLRTFNFRTQFTFYTNPYQDEYPTDTASFAGAVNNPLYDFQNKYLTVHPPAYVAGYQSLWSQSQEQFYGIYPKLNSILFTGSSGDGLTGQFSGVVNTQQAIVPNNFQQNIALLQREVLFESADTNLNGISLVDVPVVDAGSGQTTTFGNLYDPNTAAYQDALDNPPTVAFTTPFVPGTGVINYATGVYTISFTSAPGANIPINVQIVPVGLSQPRAILFYANKFVVRPVPDQVYRVNFEVYQRPTQFLETSSEPQLNEYWQYIAYGAAKKIFEDRMDTDSVQMIMPEFKTQENLVQRRTIVQYTNERTATIYTEQTGLNSSGWGWGGSGGANF